MPLSHFPISREIQLRYKGSAKRYETFASSKGERKRNFVSLVLEYNSLEELLNDLTMRYRSRESTDDILFEIQTIRQNTSPTEATTKSTRCRCSHAGRRQGIPQVRNTSPKDLRTAIEKTIDMEQRTSERRKEVKTQDSPTEVTTIRRAPARKVCGHCRRGNHKEEDCWRKNTDVRVCDFCNRRGHLYGDCATLRQALRNRQITLETIKKGRPAST